MTGKKVREWGVGTIGNYYGGLSIKEARGKFYWSIENYDGNQWKAIPKYLFDALLQYETERTAGAK
jgi:hypothetical protein